MTKPIVLVKYKNIVCYSKSLISNFSSWPQLRIISKFLVAHSYLFTMLPVIYWLYTQGVHLFV